MTFNTTSLSLRRALQKCRILERIPPKPVGPSIRYVLVTPDIDAMLDGHMHRGIFPDVAADRLIAIFSANWYVSVSKRKAQDRKDKKSKPDLEKLDGFDEVWALCPRKPKPGWRLLGRFYEKNVLIITRAWKKGDLFNRYKEASDEVIEDWRELFPNQDPHRGADWPDYLGEAYHDAD